MIFDPWLFSFRSLRSPLLEARAKVVLGSTVERGAVLDESPFETACYFRRIRFSDIGTRSLDNELFEASPSFIIVVGSMTARKGVT
jgi:hypothetical protein